MSKNTPRQPNRKDKRPWGHGQEDNRKPQMPIHWLQLIDGTYDLVDCAMSDGPMRLPITINPKKIKQIEEAFEKYYDIQRYLVHIEYCIDVLDVAMVSIEEATGKFSLSIDEVLDLMFEIGYDEEDLFDLSCDYPRIDETEPEEAINSVLDMAVVDAVSDDTDSELVTPSCWGVPVEVNPDMPKVESGDFAFVKLPFKQSKSALIRSYLTQNPDMANQDIADAVLAKHEVVVKKSLVAAVKSKLKKEKT